MARKLKSPSNRSYRLSGIRKQQWQQRQKRIRREERRDVEYERYKIEFERAYKNYTAILGEDFDRVATHPKVMPKDTYFAHKRGLLNERKEGKKHFKSARQRLINEQMGNVISRDQAKATFEAMQMRGEIDKDAKFNYATSVRLRSGIFEGQKDFYERITDFRDLLDNFGYSKKEIREEVSRTFYGSP